jgi:hypothetical protein
MSLPRFKLVFFSPRNKTSAILDALFYKFPQELGKIGEYERCAFITPGTGKLFKFSSALLHHWWDTQVSSNQLEVRIPL